MVKRHARCDGIGPDAASVRRRSIDLARSGDRCTRRGGKIEARTIIPASPADVIADDEHLWNLAARHRALSDVERTYLRRESPRAIVADFLVTDSTLSLLLEGEFELGIHGGLLVSIE